VLEFDGNGTLVSSWGGPASLPRRSGSAEAGTIGRNTSTVSTSTIRTTCALGAGGEKDAHILKFTRGGKFLMQIGKPGQGKGSNDTANLGAPANMVVDNGANELYVADGYVNHRVSGSDSPETHYVGRAAD
jgi:hypothetical protein